MAPLVMLPKKFHAGLCGALWWKAGLNDDLRFAACRGRSALRSMSRLLCRQQVAPVVTLPKKFYPGSCGALWWKAGLNDDLRFA